MRVLALLFSPLPHIPHWISILQSDVSSRIWVPHEASVCRSVPSLECSIMSNTLLQCLEGWGDLPLPSHWFATSGSVTARIGFSVDLDLHEKLLRRFGSRWCKNHVESDLYVFVSIHFFFVFRSEWICCPFKNTESYITWWDSHIKSDPCCM